MVEQPLERHLVRVDHLEQGVVHTGKRVGERLFDIDLGLGRAGIHTLRHALQHPSARILRQHLGFNTYGDLSARSIRWRFFTVLRALPGGRTLRGTKGSGHAREPTLTRASPVITTVSRTEQMVSR